MSRPRSSTSYRAIHKRLRADRGRAADLPCNSCGKSAREWAYLYNGDPELTDPEGRKYAMNTACYAPMCVSCHRKWDHQQDPERHANKAQKARERMTAINKDPRYHEQRVENSRRNGRKTIAAMREAGTLGDFTSKGGKARHMTE
jgi:hypothetical protein